jgi:molybdenum cofactor cytidylyltransferase
VRPGGSVTAAYAYADGRGHPLAFARSMFGEPAAPHGDRGVWKLLDRCGEGAGNPERRLPHAAPA